GGQFAADFNLDSFVGTNLTINGNVDNSGNFVTNFNFINGGNTLTVNGNVTNESGGNFGLFGGGDMAIVNGSLTNTGIVQLIGGGSMATINGLLTNNAGGFIDVESGSTLTINGDATNSSGPGSFQGIYTNYLGDGGNNTITITGMLTNG